jgi:hypothetical protein
MQIDMATKYKRRFANKKPKSKELCRRGYQKGLFSANSYEIVRNFK